MPDKDGGGPRRGSYMNDIGRTGPKSGHKRGDCRPEYDRT
jgi:hypothetical protein